MRQGEGLVLADLRVVNDQRAGRETDVVCCGSRRGKQRKAGRQQQRQQSARRHRVHHALEQRKRKKKRGERPVKGGIGAVHRQRDYHNSATKDVPGHSWVGRGAAGGGTDTDPEPLSGGAGASLFFFPLFNFSPI